MSSAVDDESVPAIPCSLCDRIVQPEALWVTVLVSKDENDGERDRQQVLLSHFLCYTQFLEDNGCRQFVGKVFHLCELASKVEQMRVFKQAQKLFEDARERDKVKLIESVVQDSKSADLPTGANPEASTLSPRKRPRSSSGDDDVDDNAHGAEKGNLPPAKRQARGAAALRRAYQTTTSYVSKWRKTRKLGDGSVSSSSMKVEDDPLRKAGLPLTRSATGRRQKTVSCCCLVLVGWLARISWRFSYKSIPNVVAVSVRVCVCVCV
jgi:hypothetical protein